MNGSYLGRLCGVPYPLKSSRFPFRQRTLAGKASSSAFGTGAWNKGSSRSSVRPPVFGETYQLIRFRFRVTNRTTAKMGDRNVCFQNDLRRIGSRVTEGIRTPDPLDHNQVL